MSKETNGKFVRGAIWIDGQGAERRILAVDAAGCWPIISQREGACPIAHTLDGKAYNNRTECDLLREKREPREFLMQVRWENGEPREDTLHYTHVTRVGSRINPEEEWIKVREVLE